MPYLADREIWGLIDMFTAAVASLPHSDLLKWKISLHLLHQRIEVPLSLIFVLRCTFRHSCREKLLFKQSINLLMLGRNRGDESGSYPRTLTLHAQILISLWAVNESSTRLLSPEDLFEGESGVSAGPEGCGPQPDDGSRQTA